MIGPHRLPCETPEAHQPLDHAAGATKWVLPATVLGSSLSFIDGSVVNVALPRIEQSLNASFGAIQWIVNGYMLAFASLILLGGAAGDILGRRRVFLTGLAGFVAASVACGLAPTAILLVVFRFTQGAAAALLAPASLAIIGAAYSGKTRGNAIGTWAAAGALTTAIGPALGGWIVDAIGWRGIFFITLPVGAAAIALAMKLPRDEPPERNKTLDLRGAFLAVLSLGLLSYGLIAFGEGQAAWGASALAVAVSGIFLFLRWERRTQAPMMPLSLFGSRDFSGANMLTVSLYAALSAALFLLPFLLIRTHGYSAAAAGIAFLPFSAIMGIGSPWAGTLVDKVGSRLPLLVGPGVTGLGFLVLGLSGQIAHYWMGVLPGLVVVAIGMTLSVAPLTTVVFNPVPGEASGTAAGINNAAARTGGLISVAATGLALGKMGAASLNPVALTDAYRLVMFAAAGLSLLGALIAAATISAQPKHEPQKEAPGR
jgi:EmrB/QacA subfamily drug resistance transporter